MTDNKIKKALEWLEEIKGFCSSEEKYIYATTLVDLINSQQAEIERLRKEVNLVSIQFQDLQERYEEAQAEIERLKSMNQSKLDTIHDLQSQNKILSKNADTAFQEGLNERRDLFGSEIKAKVVKEFAERLKEKSGKMEMVCSGALVQRDYTISEEILDNLVKEMVGEE